MKGTQISEQFIFWGTADWRCRVMSLRSIRGQWRGRIRIVACHVIETRPLSCGLYSCFLLPIIVKQDCVTDSASWNKFCAFRKEGPKRNAIQINGEKEKKITSVKFFTSFFQFICPAKSGAWVGIEERGSRSPRGPENFQSFKQLLISSFYFPFLFK